MLLPTMVDDAAAAAAATATASTIVDGTITDATNGSVSTKRRQSKTIPKSQFEQVLFGVGARFESTGSNSGRYLFLFGGSSERQEQ